jgi:hypothetical protein
MSQFEGSAHRARCLDCTKHADKRCSTKGCKVSPKKRRTCGSYEFKGEYENRTTPEKIRIPYVDPKTVKLMKKLVRMGLTLPGTEGSPQKTIPMPISTATGLIAPVEKKEIPLIWTPGSDDA